MEKLLSKKFTLPTVYFISDRSKIAELPIGVPFIYGDEDVKDGLLRLLEYEFIYRQAIKSGYPFDFKKLLHEAGFDDVKEFSHGGSVYMDYKTSDRTYAGAKGDMSSEELKKSNVLNEYLRDSSMYVDLDVLKGLNVFPAWLDSIQEAVEANIQSYAVYNPNMYNKKLDGVYGSVDLTSPKKNLIIIDISGSIPRAVSSTCLALAKNLSENFYADLVITGSKSTLYTHDMIQSLDVHTVYEENGMDNDQVWFKNLLEDPKEYKTAIVFGDNHSPSHAWHNKYNVDTSTIDREDGKKLCRWKVDKLISLHTGGTGYIAGYADWFEPNDTEKISDWTVDFK